MQRKHVIELFVPRNRKARQLVNRVFRMDLRDCVVILRRLPALAANETPTLTLDGRPMTVDADGRLVPPPDDNGCEYQQVAE